MAIQLQYSLMAKQEVEKHIQLQVFKTSSVNRSSNLIRQMVSSPVLSKISGMASNDIGNTPKINHKNIQSKHHSQKSTMNRSEIC